MSVEAMNLAWYVSGLSPAQKAVLVALADHASPDGSHVYPSVSRLCLKTSYAERTVRRALSDLREIGLVRVVREAKYHSATEYALDLPEMQARQDRPATDAPHDLPESPQGVPENTDRPARNAPKPSYNHQQPSDVTLILPAHLATRDMMNAWGEWLQYHEDRGRPLTKATQLKQFKQIDAWGIPRTIAAIEHSITNGYIGLVEPRASGNGSKPQDDTMDRLKARIAEAERDEQQDDYS